MQKAHKHKELIIQWANGAKIEVFNTMSGRWIDTNNPSWAEENYYRIKEEPLSIKFRVGLFNNGITFQTITADSESEEKMLEKDPDFFQWITEWNEIFKVKLG